MGWLGNLIGTDKAVNNILDKDNGLLSQVGGWIGNMSYTDEEKAKANAVTREWGIRHLEALAPFKVVQRILAFAVMSMWLVVGLNVLAAIWVDSVYGTNVKDDMLKFAMSDYVFWPALAVLSLYFTGGVVESFGRAKNKP